MSDLLMLGTSDSIHSIGGSGTDPATPNNVNQRAQTWNGTNEKCKPERSGRSLFFVGTHANDIHEMTYTDLAAAFDAPSISKVNEHLYSETIDGISFQQGPDKLLYSHSLFGDIACMLFEKEQGVVGATPYVLAGSNYLIDDKRYNNRSYIRDMCTIPELVNDAQGRVGRDYRSDMTYVLVQRYIDGKWRFYIERFEAPWEGGEEQDMWFLDSALLYDGAETDTITGLDHLEGQLVQVFAYNRYSNPAMATDPTFSEEFYEVTNGSITLPIEVTRAVVGLTYACAVQLLPFAQEGKRDGSAVGRKVKVDEVLIDLYKSRGVLVKSGSEFLREEEVVRRKADVNEMDQYIPLYSGFSRLPIDDTWEGDGEIILYSEQPFPFLIRSVTTSSDIEGP